MTNQSDPRSEFADVLAANQHFTQNFKAHALTGIARQGLAIVTCIDSRINPLDVTGMSAGDAKIIRNAGARVTEDVLRTLMLASYLLGVNRILVMPHTDCRMATSNEQAIHAQILADFNVDTRSMEFKTTSDQLAALKQDIQRIRSFPLLPTGVTAVGGIYDVSTGELALIDF